MKNFGNTCFMNAIIQCLCSTVPLSVHFFRSKPIGTGSQIADEFNVIVRATWYGQYRSITPRDFKNCCYHKQFVCVHADLSVSLCVYTMCLLIYCVFVLFQNTVAKYAPQFITSEQQDTQEFLVFVTDGMHEDLNRVSSVKPWWSI